MLDCLLALHFLLVIEELFMKFVILHDVVLTVEGWACNVVLVHAGVEPVLLDVALAHVFECVSAVAAISAASLVVAPVEDKRGPPVKICSQAKSNDEGRKEC